MNGWIWNTLKLGTSFRCSHGEATFLEGKWTENRDLMLVSTASKPCGRI